jgi:hypothetical protein
MISLTLILAHDPEKCAAVFRQDHAPTTTACIGTQQAMILAGEMPCQNLP